jgi:hypothetical protein
VEEREFAEIDLIRSRDYVGCALELKVRPLPSSDGLAPFLGPITPPNIPHLHQIADLDEESRLGSEHVCPPVM